MQKRNLNTDRSVKTLTLTLWMAQLAERRRNKEAITKVQEAHNIAKVVKGSREGAQRLEVTFAQIGNRSKGRWRRPIDEVHIVQTATPKRVSGAIEEVEGLKDFFQPDHPH